MKSSFSFFIITPTLFILGWSLYRIIRSPIPMPNTISLAFQAGNWVLEKNDGEQSKFEKLKISFNGGFFMLLTLTDDRRRKTIVLFNDQITAEQNRILRIVDKIA